jgi:hypothetical protein
VRRPPHHASGGERGGAGPVVPGTYHGAPAAAGLTPAAGEAILSSPGGDGSPRVAGGTEGVAR